SPLRVKTGGWLRLTKAQTLRVGHPRTARFDGFDSFLKSRVFQQHRSFVERVGLAKLRHIS
ncbi:MAG: hypothetical protein ACRYFU_10075, partial [Janthinobacterium lividum]